MKDILIIGTQRCGKSTVTNYILDKYHNYEAMRGDALLIATQCFCERVVKEKEDRAEIEITMISEEKKLEYLTGVYEELKIDLKPIGKNIIIDTHEIDVDNAIKKFGDTCNIYCLGMPNEKVEDLLVAICKNDTQNDWTYYMGTYRLELICRDIIERSKINQEKCKKNNIPFFDMAGNRKEKIEQVINQIEKDMLITC